MVEQAVRNGDTVVIGPDANLAYSDQVPKQAAPAH